MKTIIGLLAIFVSSLLLFNCSKSDSAPSKTALLTRANGWGVTSKTFNGTEQIEDCDKDDVFIFLANKTFTLTFGSNHCDPAEATETNQWDIYGDNQNLLNIHTANSSLDYTIVELTATSLKISFTDNTGTFAFTFVGK